MAAPEFHLVAIAKDEGRYIREWLAYSLHLGPRSITVYDNDSRDDTAAILDRAARHHPVRRIPWPTQEGQSPQMGAYNDALARLRAQTGGADVWVGFFDLDEFLVETGALTLAQILQGAAADPGIGAIGISQRLYGDSGLADYAAEPVLKRFSRCCLPDYVEGTWIKSIYRLPCIARITDAHGSALERGAYVFPDLTPITFASRHSECDRSEQSLLQLNHYITKSLEEFLLKRERGGAMAQTEAGRKSRYADMGFFHHRQALLNRMACPHHARLSAMIDRQMAAAGF